MKKTVAAALAVAVAMSTAAAIAAPVSGKGDDIIFSGDLRVRYDVVDNDAGMDDDNIAKYRLRLNLQSKLTDYLTLNLRFSNGENEFSKADDKLIFDRYNLVYKKPKYSMIIGRQDVKIFDGLAVNTVTWAGEDTADNPYAALNGLTASTKFGKVQATAYVGEISDNRAFNNSASAPNDYDTYALVLSTKLSKVNVGVAFVDVSESQKAVDVDKNFTIFAVNSQLARDWYLGTEFVSGLNSVKDNAWQVCLNYGALKNVGDVLYELKYKDVERNALQKYYTDSWKKPGKDYTFWSFGATKRFATNFDGKLYYEDYDYSTGPDQNTTRLELLYRF